MGIGNIAMTGMDAAITNMETISNNISNANTYGFKSSSIQFADVYPSGVGVAISPGLGVQVMSMTQDFSTGGLALTNIGSDFSIGNNCFFIMRDPANGASSYTRYGHFTVDNQGYMTFNGSRLQGFQASNGVILDGSNIADLQIDSTPIPANASTKINVGSTNLNASDSAPADAFDPTIPTTYNLQVQTYIFDSLGNKNPANIFYVKSSTTPDTWNVYVQVNGNILTSIPGDPTGTATFDTSGNITGTTGLTGLSFDPTSGATSPQEFEIDMTSATQFALPDAAGQATQDGYQAGTLSGYQFDTSGNLTLLYSNGINILTGQIALASFSSTAGLQDIGSMSWVSTTASGTPFISQTNSSGAITSGTLELSNVDLTQEMVNLVTAQNVFQANAQVENVYNQIMQTVIQI